MDILRTPPRPRIVIPRNRQSVTGEPDPGGRWSSAFPDMLGYGSLGGGSVSGEVVWLSSPKQRQEELNDTNIQLRRLQPDARLALLAYEKRALAALPEGTTFAPLPAGVMAPGPASGSK
jgi:hypothetical protein